MLDQRVAALELERLRNLPDAEYHRPPVGANLDFRPSPMEEVQEACGLFVFGFDTRFRQDDVGPELLSDIVRHDLACAFRLRVLKCQAELVEPVPGQMKPLEHRPRDPAAAIICSQGVVLYDHHPGVGQLDSLFARRHQDAEIGDGCFRPFTEALRNRRLIAFVHGVELAALRRGARAYESKPHTIKIERPHRSLNFVFLVIFESPRWDIESCDANVGIKTLEECIFELLFLGQSWQHPLHLPHLVDIDRNHRHPTAYFIWHFLLLIFVRQGTEKEAVAAGLFAVLGRKRGTVSGQVREEPDQAYLFMGSSTLCTSSLLRLFLPCLLGNNKQGVC